MKGKLQYKVCTWTYDDKHKRMKLIEKKLTTISDNEKDARIARENAMNFAREVSKKDNVIVACVSRISYRHMTFHDGIARFVNGKSVCGQGKLVFYVDVARKSRE